MIGSGYEFSYGDQSCQPNMYDAEDQNPYCYRPAGMIGRLTLKIELAIERIN
jgi:hypothetical protein